MGMTEAQRLQEQEELKTKQENALINAEKESEAKDYFAEDTQVSEEQHDLKEQVKRVFETNDTDIDEEPRYYGQVMTEIKRERRLKIAALVGACVIGLTIAIVLIVIL